MRKDAELSRKLKTIMTKGRDSLGVAKQLHKQNHFNDAASRTYYAVFHSLQAILLTKNLSFSKHSAVLSAFNKEFVHGGVFSNDFYTKIIRIFKDRQVGDYAYEMAVSRESSEADVTDAEMIINAIEKYLQREGYLSV
ncbi:MAG: HEPN domain-containing protein [Candidatus Brocadiaceae bacterium]|nr:HEPN domain-containing protein [Candidatus Brocadiaceae bacterium]